MTRERDGDKYGCTSPGPRSANHHFRPLHSGKKTAPKQPRNPHTLHSLVCPNTVTCSQAAQKDITGGHRQAGNQRQRQTSPNCSLRKPFPTEWRGGFRPRGAVPWASEVGTTTHPSLSDPSLSVASHLDAIGCVWTPWHALQSLLMPLEAIGAAWRNWLRDALEWQPTHGTPGHP